MLQRERYLDIFILEKLSHCILLGNSSRLCRTNWHLEVSSQEEDVQSSVYSYLYDMNQNVLSFVARLTTTYLCLTDQ